MKTPSQQPKPPQYDKWRSLRRWVRAVHQDAQQSPEVRSFGDPRRRARASHRAEAFKAVLLVMDMENRRARLLNQEPKP